MSHSSVAPARPGTGPAEQFEEFAARPGCVWLDTASGEGVSLLAAEPAKIFRAKGARGVFDRLRAELDGWRGYAVGYFGYDLKNEIERLPARAVDDLGLPDCWFGFYDDVRVFEVGPSGPPRRAEVRRRSPDRAASSDRQVSIPATEDLRSATRAGSGDPRTTEISARWASAPYQRQQFLAAVRRAKEYIAAGDIYQVNLSQRFQCEATATAPEVYLALRASNPAPYAAYLDIGDAQILSTSPECFLNIRGRHVVTRPIKGTSPRERDPNQLLRSPKDNAELLMITDLERNDLGRVCEFGSVFVSELRRVETFATVHHLVATVEGQLRRDVSHIDCLRACFPGGSITGAPKIRAMEIIDELEPHARGVYCGAIGYFGPNHESHFNIAIRTVVYQAIVGQASSLYDTGVSKRNRLEACSTTGRLTFHAGGGIVADSEPDAEYEETLAKARGILNAIEQLRVR